MSASASPAASARKLLLVFGLRGTLLERVRSAPHLRLPPAPHVIGTFKVWPRPGVHGMLQRLHAQGHHIAIWSSTTQRNTAPLLDVVFPQFPFAFVWTRENTAVDTFRRLGASVDKDSDHATLKDLDAVYQAFGADDLQQLTPASSPPAAAPTSPSREAAAASLRAAATPFRTILVDDSPSKARRHCENFLWLPPYGVEDVEAAIAASPVMPPAYDAAPCPALARFEQMIHSELAPAADVRTLLPRRLHALTGFNDRATPATTMTE